MVNSLEKVAAEIRELGIKREVYLKATHSRFNVFTTVLQAHDEVRLHTRFLHMLLNKKGCHDSDGKYLNLFLETLQETNMHDHEGNPADVKQILSGVNEEEFVYSNNEEFRQDYGRFDIYMEFKNSIVLIENKIWAGEEEQLERYAKFLAAHKNKKTLLLYLTLDGKAASTSNGYEYYRISYKNHILKWLEKCLQSTYSFVNINQALQQYRSVVKQLLGNTLEAEDMEKIKKMLKEKFEMSQLNLIQDAIKGIKQDRENEVHTMCEKVLHRRANVVHNWGNDYIAFKFFDDLWGKANTTDLTLLMSSDGKYSLRAYDAQNGSMMNAFEDGRYSGEWITEKNYYFKDFFESKNLDDVVKELNEVIKKLKCSSNCC